jgi:hypothetical protein
MFLMWNLVYIIIVVVVVAASEVIRGSYRQHGDLMSVTLRKVG